MAKFQGRMLSQRNLWLDLGRAIGTLLEFLLKPADVCRYACSDLLTPLFAGSFCVFSFQHSSLPPCIRSYSYKSSPKPSLLCVKVFQQPVYHQRLGTAHPLLEGFLTKFLPLYKCFATPTIVMPVL